MSFISQMKRQVCVHWHRTGTDAKGRAIWAMPVELACRWEGINENFIALNGEERTSQAKVYVSGITVGDVLLLGTLSDSGLNTTDPLRNEGAWEVRRYDAMPNLRNTETLYTAYV